MNKNILIFSVIFLSIVMNSYNPDYYGDNAEVSYETFFMKDRMIKEDYIRYFK